MKTKWPCSTLARLLFTESRVLSEVVYVLGSAQPVKASAPLVAPFAVSGFPRFAASPMAESLEPKAESLLD